MVPVLLSTTGRRCILFSSRIRQASISLDSRVKWRNSLEETKFTGARPLSVCIQSLLSTVDDVLPILQRLREDLHGDIGTLVVLLQNSEEFLSIVCPVCL